MVVYLRDEVTPDQREALIARLTELYGTATYVSPEQAWEEFSQQVGDPQLLQAVDQNPLPASLRVRLRPELLNYPAMEQAAKQVSQFPEVEDVRYGGEWVRRLDELQATLARGSLVVGVAVALAILLIIYNIIRLTVMARRRDVVIDVLDDPGMSPGQQLVQVAELGVKFVVFLGPDDHERMGVALPQRFGDTADAAVRKRFAVADAQLAKDCLLVVGRVKAGDDKRPEIIPFSGLVRPDMPGRRGKQPGLSHRAS